MHPILKLVAQRLALGALLLFAASALIFGLTEVLPGDAAQALLGQSATPENLANLREEMGLDRPKCTGKLPNTPGRHKTGSCIQY